MSAAWINRTHVGDCRELLPRMAADGVRVQTCVTSPPYFGLRDYGVEGQIGLEASPQEYVGQLVEVFRAVREVLADDGTLWLNLGDSYAGKGGGGQGKNGQRADRRFTAERMPYKCGAAPKNLLGMPWRLAFALQDDGWILRSDIIWHKPCPMPESVTDRPTTAHEHLFLLAKAESYYYDADGIKEPAVAAHPGEMDGGAQRQIDGSNANEGRNFRGPKDIGRAGQGLRDSTRFARGAGFRKDPGNYVFMRNRRSVWTIASEPFKGAHFACFPRGLIEPCIVAGCPPGGIVLDPFMGSGTTGQVATDLGRQFIGCELSAEYLKLHEMRRTTVGMPF